jgi:DNA-binding NarL/FixJ family response regulator
VLAQWQYADAVSIREHPVDGGASALKYLLLTLCTAADQLLNYAKRDRSPAFPTWQYVCHSDIEVFSEEKDAVKKMALYQRTLAAKDTSLDLPVMNFSGCKPVALQGRNYTNFTSNLRANSHKECTIHNWCLLRRDALPQWQRGGRKASMAIALQVVSSHHLGVLNIERALSIRPTLVDRLLPHAASEADALKRPDLPRLFLLDGCSLTSPLGPLSGRLRANSPGSKFLVLLAPERNALDKMVRLLHWGIDGILELDEKWQTELQKAVLAVLGDRLWVPPEVLLAFAQEMRILLDKQLLPGHSLTARESQVLQLLFRRLTNKEIARELEISVRTAKFHVCNLLNKLGLENRRNLLEGFGSVEST